MMIAGIGLALPSHSISQADAAVISRRFAGDDATKDQLFGVLYRRSGVENRHCVVLDRSNGESSVRQSFYQEVPPSTSERMRSFEREAGPLAIAAAQRALDRARVSPHRVTHIVTVSCSGFHSPGFDTALIKSLPLRPDVARTHVGFMGCHGALNGLRVARAFTESDPSSCVLVCAVELCSLHHQYGWDANKIVANALFADGAAAVVGLGADLPTTTDGLRIVSNGSTLIVDSEDAMSWRIGDEGFVMSLSARVPMLIARELRPWLESWLKGQGLTIGSVGSWAVHPGGPRILGAVLESLGLPRSALSHSFEVLAQYGNMSSPTVLFILDRLHRAGAPRPWVAMAFGPGLAVETMMVR